MIHVPKSAAVPNSLELPGDEKKVGRQRNNVRTKTHDRRLQLIAKGDYIGEGAFNERYKQADVKRELKALYGRKCCYCESHLVSWAVEHYRPKHIYYWLAYSWDNLLLACERCNTKKGTDFATRNGRVTFQEKDLENIHRLATSYAELEQPLLLHPELDRPQPLFTFELNGQMQAVDERAVYTLNTCGLNRKDLCDDRARVLASFKKDLTFALLDATREGRDVNHAISQEVKRYKRHADDAANSFRAFREFGKGFLKGIIAEVLLTE